MSNERYEMHLEAAARTAAIDWFQRYEPTIRSADTITRAKMIDSAVAALTDCFCSEVFRQLGKVPA